jgi:sulfhydrogenase subunit beta (sulfur reductase)
MRILKLKKSDLFPFLEVISKETELWAPLKKGEKYVFERVADFSKIELQTTRTIIPPKKIMVPPTFNMFHVNETGYKEDFSHVTKKILFGVHPCDIHGLLILDKLFVQEYPDPYYLGARKNTMILGLSCMPDEYCFCQSTRTNIIEEGYDLFFTDLETYFLVWIGSSQGDDLVRLAPGLFEESLSDKDIQTYIRWQKVKEKAFKIEIDFISMPDLVELKYKASFWQKAGDACLACGSCSMVCPTRNCYNVNDKLFLGKRPGKRIRLWDSCTLPEYSQVAGGENFREHKSDRLKLWYTHKLQAFVSKFGKPSCVGCGRCIATCPVNINVKTIAQALEGEDVDAFWNRMSREVTK